MKLLPTLVAAAVATLLHAAPAAAGHAQDLARLTAQFEAYSGARLVFSERALPPGDYYDRMPGLSAAQRVDAARIALAEARKYPPGYLGEIGLTTVGLFAACVSKSGDGFREYDDTYRGYLYFGMWNGDSALVAAYYSDQQLPLTFHHEVFHHVDATVDGKTDYARHFTADDDAFARAIGGKSRYAAAVVDRTDRAALRKRAEGVVLRGAVSTYANKSPGEDQAETARHLMTSLPDSLLQVAAQPRLAGSQRMLHVLAAYRRAAPDGPDIDWFVDVALGRTEARTTAAFARAADDAYQRVRDRIAPKRSDTIFTVWGAEDARGVNETLRRDVRGFAAAARRLGERARAIRGTDEALARVQLKTLRLLSRYYLYIDARWRVTPGTRRAFEEARATIAAALPASWGARRNELGRMDFAVLGIDIARDGSLRGALAEPVADNPHLAKVDAAIRDGTLRRAIRRVQPATVRLDNGSGVVIDPGGVVLTAAHVAKRKGAVLRAELPDGRTYRAVCTHIDDELDLAVLAIDTRDVLPAAPIAPVAPKVGDTVVAIGQPGKYTPDGERTGYQPFHVSVGEIRGFLPNRLGPQSLGRTKHDAWTYWGHSGCPLFDDQGRIVALHNSWDSTTAMRHAVTWEAIARFLADAGIDAAPQ